MPKFVRYIYFEGLGGDRRNDLLEPADMADISTIHVPQGAVGFSFIEAETRDAGENTKNKNLVTYFLANGREQITSTKEMRECGDPLYQMTANMLEEHGCKRVFGQWPLWSIGMRDQDIVLDAKTRKILTLEIN